MGTVAAFDQQITYTCVRRIAQGTLRRICAMFRAVQVHTCGTMSVVDQDTAYTLLAVTLITEGGADKRRSRWIHGYLS